MTTHTKEELKENVKKMAFSKADYCDVIAIVLLYGRLLTVV
jgi:hypothetical protein